MRAVSDLSTGPSGRIVERLDRTLGQEGWQIRVCRHGVRARWSWLSVSLKVKPTKAGRPAWRARLRDGFPRTTVSEHWADDPMEVLDDVIAHARKVRRFSDGRLCLLSNPSKTWLGHRLWQAVRPLELDEPDPSQ